MSDTSLTPSVGVNVISSLLNFNALLTLLYLLIRLPCLCYTKLFIQKPSQQAKTVSTEKPHLAITSMAYSGRGMPGTFPGASPGSSDGRPTPATPSDIPWIKEQIAVNAELLFPRIKTRIALVARGGILYAQLVGPTPENGDFELLLAAAGKSNPASAYETLLVYTAAALAEGRGCLEKSPRVRLQDLIRREQ